jgi:pyruvate dehydrogenase E2 component (dihydrolipoamide acetyltransferase)
MPFTVTMPKLSPTMEEGTIAKWHKKVGDHVDSGELLIEVTTDKATVEFNAIDEGWVRKILIEEGANAAVNQAIAIFTEEKEESIESYQPEGLKKAEKKDLSTERSSEVKENKEITTSQEQKSTATRQPSFVPEPPLENFELPFLTDQIEKRVLASPLAKFISKQQHLDISTVKGSGPGGRIMSRDLENAQPSRDVSFGHREVPKEIAGSFVEEPLNQMRKAIGQRLQDAKSYIPHFYIEQSINAQPLTDLREQLRNFDIKISVNDCVVRACALALKKHMIVNSGFNSETNSIIRFKTIDISVAVSIKDGLITPIIRHADFKNLGQISTEIRSLAQRAKEGKLNMQEYKGGSFTISNLGMYGVTNFAAIINPPQAAILAVSGISNVPVVKAGAVVPGKVMHLNLSVDHRVVDGVAAAEFLKTLQLYLENPAALMI